MENKNPSQLDEFLDSCFPEKPNPNEERNIEITKLKKGEEEIYGIITDAGYRVSRKFKVENSFKQPFNQDWCYYAENYDNSYLLKMATDESRYRLIQRDLGIAHTLRKAEKRLHKEAIKGAKLIAEAYGGKIKDLANE